MINCHKWFSSPPTLLILTQQLSDQCWHKIMLGVTDDRAKLWLDCQPVRSVQGYIESPLKERGDYYTQDGYLSIVQIANTRTSYQVRIARQFMMTVFKQMINFSSLFSLQSAPPVSIHNRWIEFLLFSLCPRIEDIPPPFPSLST